MLLPSSVTIRRHTNKPVIVARYPEGFIAFYQPHDIANMFNLFYPGDREMHPTEDAALDEIDRFGFE